jgi:hypothetical protein
LGTKAAKFTRLTQQAIGHHKHHLPILPPPQAERRNETPFSTNAITQSQLSATPPATTALSKHKKSAKHPLFATPTRTPPSNPTTKPAKLAWLPTLVATSLPFKLTLPQNSRLSSASAPLSLWRLNSPLPRARSRYHLNQ